MTSKTTCRDCPPGSKRPVVKAGRCATHAREFRRQQTERTHAAYVLKTYGLEDYPALHEYQGGKCFICQRATGATRRLAVDHDHASGYVRGLLCKPCNRMLGLARDDPEFFRRAIAYLEDPPAQAMGVWAKPKETP